MCRALNVSRSGYYDWRRGAPARESRLQRRQHTLTVIKRIHEDSRKSYGSPRIHRALREEGVKCGRYTVERLMSENGVYGKQKRKWVATTDSRHDNPVVHNRLNREFKALEPDRKWAGDITYIATEEGWLYLAAIMDLHSRSIVGWPAGERITTDLVSMALDRALEKRKPGRGLIFHSDRGSQYTSREYQMKLWRNGIIGSMSRKGNCWDNAPMESFFGAMKSEWIYGSRKYRTREEARADIFKYIEIFYNRKRLHSGLGYKSPETYEKERLWA